MPSSEPRPVVDTLDVPLSDPALRDELLLLGDFMVAANRSTGPMLSPAEVDLILHLVHPSGLRKLASVGRQRTPAT